ncbi:F-box/kelch-repeat protein At3g24760 [Henckelia pumila]|uniref:F-box/kelch-repeat protein At3g24760 n=1 Tax=Henckelia pumila TaxID=405737 RepID=UPI003C6E7B5D
MNESDPNPCQKTNNSSPGFDFLGSDLIESILSRLPIASILRAASVCKLWNSTIHSSSLEKLVSDSGSFPSWLFLLGQNNHPLLAFDPESNCWIRFSKETCFSSDSFVASSGFIFSLSLEKFSFRPVFCGRLCQTRPLRFPRRKPLIHVYLEPDFSKQVRFIVVGGISLLNQEDCLAVEIYSPDENYWELCQPLNEIFHPGNSAQSLCSALFKGKFFVYDKYSCFISSFDLIKRSWSNPKTLRPPGTLLSSLISIRDRLVLAGLCSTYNGGLEFIIWNIDDRTLEFSEIAIMPRDLLSFMIDRESGQMFSSLKCAGSGRYVYVFNEEFSGDFPVCVWEMSDSGNGSWRRIPGFPDSVNTNFQNAVSFCFDVSLQYILHGQES